MIVISCFGNQGLNYRLNYFLMIQLCRIDVILIGRVLCYKPSGHYILQYIQRLLLFGSYPLKNLGVFTFLFQTRPAKGNMRTYIHHKIRLFKGRYSYTHLLYDMDLLYGMG